MKIVISIVCQWLKKLKTFSLSNFKQWPKQTASIWKGFFLCSETGDEVEMRFAISCLREKQREKSVFNFNQEFDLQIELVRALKFCPCCCFLFFYYYFWLLVSLGRLVLEIITQKSKLSMKYSTHTQLKRWAWITKGR